MSQLELTPEQKTKLLEIESQIARKYENYASVKQQVESLKAEGDASASTVEGYGKYRKQVEDGIAAILTEEQIALVDPRPVPPPKPKPKDKPEGPKKRPPKIDLGKLGLLQLNSEQQAQIQILQGELNALQANLYETILKVEQIRSKAKEIGKPLHPVEEEYRDLVLAMLTPEQILKLPRTGPPPKEKKEEKETEKQPQQ